MSTWRPGKQAIDSLTDGGELVPTQVGALCCASSSTLKRARPRQRVRALFFHRSVKCLNDFLNHLLGIGEKHHRIVHIEYVIVDTGITDTSHGTLHKQY